MVFLVDALQILGKKVIINYVAKLNHRPKQLYNKGKPLQIDKTNKQLDPLTIQSKKERAQITKTICEKDKIKT